MEDIINQIEGNVQVIFEITPDVGYAYRDALWFTQEVYNTLTQEEINTMKQDRFNNYLSHKAEFEANQAAIDLAEEEAARALFLAQTQQA